MKEDVLNKANAFKGLNELAMKGEIVVFGSTYMANFPFYELINKSKLENAVYNRSIAGLTIAEAEALLQVCVLDIRPSKVFLHLGEEDFAQPDAVEKYAAIVKRIATALPNAKIYLIDIQKEEAREFNKCIAKLGNKKNISYIHFAGQSTPDTRNYKMQFKELSCFFRSHPITLSEAFMLANV